MITQNDARNLFQLVLYTRKAVEDRLKRFNLKLLEMDLVESKSPLVVLDQNVDYYIKGVAVRLETKEMKSFKIRLILEMEKVDRESVEPLANEIAGALEKAFYPTVH